MAGKAAADSLNTPALTISALAKRFALSRSALLHYHRIQLFKPSGRSPAGHRIYGADAIARLGRICELRQAGLSLRTIKQVLEAKTPLGEALEEQIGVLNRQVSALRVQQRVVSSLLELSASGAKRGSHRALSKETWTEMFRAIGMSEDGMRQWHANFEKTMPAAHADFLHSLGLGAEEIQRIRAWSGA